LLARQIANPPSGLMQPALPQAEVYPACLRCFGCSVSGSRRWVLRVRTVGLPPQLLEFRVPQRPSSTRAGTTKDNPISKPSRRTHHTCGQKLFAKPPINTPASATKTKVVTVCRACQGDGAGFDADTAFKLSEPSESFVEHGRAISGAGSLSGELAASVGRGEGSGNRRYGADVATRLPTILATSGGFAESARLDWEVGPLTRFAVELAGVVGRAPRVCFLGTASGDDRRLITTFYDNAWREGWVGSHISLLSMPNIADLREHLLAQDVVWVWGGSVAALLAMWRLHGLDSVFLEVWQSGVVLTGVSAGSICWHVGGTTDSFGPDLRAVTNGLALLPWSNGVHYDSEPVRRPLFQSLIAAGTLPMGYATDDGAGLLYRGTDLVEALTERVDAGAYRVRANPGGGVTEEPLDVRRLR